MTKQTEKPTGGSGLVDVLWAVVAGVLVIAGLVAYYALTAQPMYVRAIALIAGLVVGVGVFAVSGYGRLTWQFMLGSRVELRKMVWPSMRDTRVTTAIVFVFVVALGIFFWIVDWLLAHGTRALLGTGS